MRFSQIRGLFPQWPSVEQTETWLHEEQLAEKQLAEFERYQAQEAERQRRFRFQDEGAIKQWLILAPIRLAEGESGMDGLDREQVHAEAKLRPKAGEKVAVGDMERVWQETQLNDFVVDFSAVLGQSYVSSIAYAVCYVTAPEPRGGLLLKIGSDDQAKVYLNGKPVHQNRNVRPMTPDEDTVAEIELQKGRNVIVLKIVNEDGNWAGSLRFTDRDGNPLKGIRVAVDPETKD